MSLYGDCQRVLHRRNINTPQRRETRRYTPLIGVHKGGKDFGEN